MAIGYLNVAIIGRSSGRSAVAAAAYASRTDLTDDRTGTAYRYARKNGDLVHSFLWLPKDAPERLRDRATLWNEVEKADNRKNSQTARRIILALPHELTTKQQQQLLQDFVRENFTRKGLAVDASIHEPDAKGDERNHHAHLLVPTRFMDNNGLGKKDRVSNDQATGLEAWRASWVKLANRQLDRYGHAARITFELAEGRTAQNHMGPEATALERQGIETRAGDDRLEVITDNMQPPANDNQRRTIGKEFAAAAKPAPALRVTEPTTPEWLWEPANDNARRKPEPQPETIDRDRQDAEWQDSIDQAGIAHVEERRQGLLQTQATERATYERHREEMTSRHAVSWAEAVHRHAVEMAEAHGVADTSYQPGTMAEAEQAAAWGLSFAIGMAASVFDSALSLFSPSRRQAKQQQRSVLDRSKKKAETPQERQKRDQHQQEMNAIAVQQTHEREGFERRRTAMLQDQQRARDHFEQGYADPSALQQAFDIHGRYVDSYRAEIERMAARKEARQERERERGGPEIDGPELKL